MADNIKKQSWPFQIPNPDPAAVMNFNLYRTKHGLSKADLFSMLVDMLPPLSETIKPVSTGMGSGELTPLPAAG